MWPFTRKPKDELREALRQLDPAYVETIVSAWMAHMTSTMSMSLHDVSTLPHPKAEIEQCMLAAIMAAKRDLERHDLERALRRLSAFQQGVGPRGRILPEHRRHMMPVPPDLSAEFEALRELSRADRARYDEAVARL